MTRTLPHLPRAERLSFVLMAVLALFTAACGPHGDPRATRFETRGADCASCHVDEWRATASPIHAALGFGQECAGCHTQQQWSPAHGFVHTQAFPLTLGHADVRCGACHAGNPPRYAGTSPACAGCHADDRARADRDVAGHASYATTCERCHGFESFRPSTKQ